MTAPQPDVDLVGLFYGKSAATLPPTMQKFPQKQKARLILRAF